MLDPNSNKIRNSKSDCREIPEAEAIANGQEPVKMRIIERDTVVS